MCICVQVCARSYACNIGIYGCLLSTPVYCSNIIAFFYMPPCALETNPPPLPQCASRRARKWRCSTACAPRRCPRGTCTSRTATSTLRRRSGALSRYTCVSISFVGLLVLLVWLLLVGYVGGLFFILFFFKSSDCDYCCWSD